MPRDWTASLFGRKATGIRNQEVALWNSTVVIVTPIEASPIFWMVLSIAIHSHLAGKIWTSTSYSSFKQWSISLTSHGSIMTSPSGRSSCYSIYWLVSYKCGPLQFSHQISCCPISCIRLINVSCHSTSRTSSVCWQCQFQPNLFLVELGLSLALWSLQILSLMKRAMGTTQESVALTAHHTEHGPTPHHNQKGDTAIASPWTDCSMNSVIVLTGTKNVIAGIM